MKKYKLFVFLIIISATLSLFTSAVISMLFKNNFSFAWNWKYFFTEITFVVFVFLFGSILAISLYVLFKQKLLGFKTSIERTEKADSKLYGDSEWQTNNEVDKNYQKCTFTNPIEPIIPKNMKKKGEKHKKKDASIKIPNDKEIQGIVVKSEISNEKLLCNVAYGKHTLITGTSGTGKSKYFLDPAIQFLGNTLAQPSMLITDPKGELFNDNSKLLAMNGYDIKVLNLSEPKRSHKYNPLTLIWRTYQDYLKSKDKNGLRDSTFLDETEALIRELSITLCPVTDSKGGWEQGGQNIIQGIIWAMLEDSEDKKFGMTEEKFLIWQINNILSQGNDLLKDFCLRRPKESTSLKLIRKYVDSKAEETSDSYISTATNRIVTFAGSGLSELMKRTDIDISGVQAKPTAIFLIVPDENTARHPLATVFVSQVYKQLISIARENQRNAAKNGISREQNLDRDFYFLLDEFGNFPKMDCIEQMLSIGRSRKVWTMISVQSISQLHKIYGKEMTATLLNNLHLQVFLGATELDTLKYFSEYFGNKTIRKNSISLQSADLKNDLQGNTQLEKAALINPDELGRLKPGEIVFKCFQHNPVRSKLVPIFNKEMCRTGVFKTGKTDVDFNIDNDKAFDPKAVFYDLVERDNNYDNIGDVLDDSAFNAVFDDQITQKNEPVERTMNTQNSPHILDIVKSLIE